MKSRMALVLALVLVSLLMTSFAVGESVVADTAEALTPVESLVDASGNIVFNDALVEEAIRNYLGILEGPVTKKQLAKLGSGYNPLFIISDTPQTADLSLLQLCPKLKMLFLDGVTPKNWNAVTACKGLTYFGAYRLDIPNLSFLVGIKSLFDIALNDSTVTDISAVTELKKLISFSIETPIQDISPLYACAKLTRITLAGISEEQLNLLLDARGKKCKELGLKDCALSDTALARIAALKLTGLSLNNVDCSSLASLLTIKTLKWPLSLSNMKMDSLEGIQNLTKLQSLTLTNIAGLTDYTPIYQLKGLKSLSMTDCAAPNLQGVENLKQLTSLSIDNPTGTFDLTPAFALTKLDTLGLYNLKITSLAGIEALKKLKTLYLYGLDGVTDYTPLSLLKKIQTIYTDKPSALPEGLPVY